jgi:hypothetical protein
MNECVTWEHGVQCSNRLAVGLGSPLSMQMLVLSMIAEGLIPVIALRDWPRSITKPCSSLPRLVSSVS